MLEVRVEWVVRKSTTREHYIQTCGAFRRLCPSSWGKSGLVHTVCEDQVLHNKLNNRHPSHKTQPRHQDEHDCQNVYCFQNKKKKRRRKEKALFKRIWQISSGAIRAAVKGSSPRKTAPWFWQFQERGGSDITGFRQHPVRAGEYEWADSPERCLQRGSEFYLGTFSGHRWRILHYFWKLSFDGS